MSSIMVKYLAVNSLTYGEYYILKLVNISAKELNKKPELAEELRKNFGDRFVLVKESAEGERDYFLNEQIIGVPTPEFERQIVAGSWQEREVELNE